MVTPAFRPIVRQLGHYILHVAAEEPIQDHGTVEVAREHFGELCGFLTHCAAEVEEHPDGERGRFILLMVREGYLRAERIRIVAS